MERYATIYCSFKGRTIVVGALQNPNPTKTEIQKALSKYRAATSRSFNYLALLKPDEGPTFVPEQARVLKEYS
jgi:hypothetical protein